jgi:hypothetical protein
LDEALRRGDQPTQPFTPPEPETRTRPLISRSRDVVRPGRGRGGALAVLALVPIAVLAVAVIAVSGGSSGGGDAGKKEAKRTTAKKGGSTNASGGSQQASNGEAAAGSAAPSAAPVSASSDGAALNAQGFALINEGRYEEAVPILRQAVASYPEGTNDLNYAYALYNLGKALRLSGHPDEAIPILERRLEIPDQQSTVAAELGRARAEAGTD